MEEKGGVRKTLSLTEGAGYAERKEQMEVSLPGEFMRKSKFTGIACMRFLLSLGISCAKKDHLSLRSLCALVSIANGRKTRSFTIYDFRLFNLEL